MFMCYLISIQLHIMSNLAFKLQTTFRVHVSAASWFWTKREFKIYWFLRMAPSSRVFSYFSGPYYLKDAFSL